MRLSVETLQQEINQSKIHPLYVVVSTSYWLLQEVKDRIWKAVKAKGHSERQVWEVTPSLFNIEAIKKKNSVIDLFYHAFIELRCIGSLKADKGEQLYKVVQWLSTQKTTLSTIVISCDQPIYKLQKASWFQKLTAISTLVILEAPTSFELPQWIQSRLQSFGLAITKEALSTFIQYTEGNLLSVIQIINKLSIMYGNQKSVLALADLNMILEDQATFELFHLTEALLSRNITRCIRILQHLKDVHVPEALILGYLMKVLRTVAGLRYGLHQGYTLPQLFQKHNVWVSQQSGFKKIVENLKVEDIPSLFHLAYRADRCIKGADTQPKWSDLQTIILYLAGYPREYLYRSLV